ncbi:MAG TPA: septum formation initiator family protein [Candidatus Paceibacterota bacterium]
MRKAQPIYHGWRRVAYSWPVLAIMTLFVIFIGRATWRVYERWDRARGERKEAENRYEGEISRQAKLESDIARLKTERGWEELIRKNFQLAKPGEGVIIIIDEATSTR